MRSPEHQQVAPPRAGRQFEDELQLHYLAPGAFTVLPPERRHPPDPPPTAPEPYRLTPSTKRHKKPSFAIIGDIDSNTLTSDSSSFTGRVSPFKGRGFNPHGSRHASRQSSPTPSSPPPEDARLTPSGSSPSKIPLPQKKEALGEKGHRGGARRRISNKLSQSLSDLDVEEQRGVAQNAKKRVYTKATGFQRLSPIIGSSPEPSQSMSSPSRIPRSQSTPPSRKPSPSRYISSTSSKPPLSNSSVHRSRSQSRIQSRNASRNPSRTASRETSPTKLTTSPSRIPLSKYKNIQAKVDSNNKPKPKVLPKPEVTSDESEPAKPKLRIPLSRKESVNRMRSDSRPNLLPKTGNYAKNNYNSTSDSSVGGRDSSKGSINKNSASTAPSSNNNVINKGKIPKRDQVIEKTAEEAITNSDNSSSVKSSNAKSNDPNNSDSNAVGSNEVKPQIQPISEITSKLEFKPDNLPSTATAVSSTTSTVAKPLKIETNLNFPEHMEKPKPRSPMIDGRVLSATSVSNAMNRMNDTVLDTQTLMRDRGFSKLSLAANAVISVANEANAALDTKNATSALPTVEPLPKNGEKTTPKNNHAAKNHNGHAKQIEHVLSSKALELEVQKHMQKLITPERKVGSNGRSVVTSDVQPIQIMVKEKPSDVEVQSGNIRPVISVSNGTTERPGLPPTQATPPNEPEKEPPQKNPCTKLLTSCKSKLCCCCAASDTKKSVEKNGSNVGCFACLKKKPAPATIIIEDEMGRKPKLLDRLNCCKSQKVGDMSCFPKSRRKENWAERRDSILSAPTPPRSKSKNFLRKMFCMDLCCKKKGIEEIERKPSLVSKKKSLTLTTALPPEDNSPKIDLSLVEHSSHMKAAIPILPICLAWFCLVMNCLVPGSGTILSGLFCLCMGIPRFSQKDGPRPRIGSFLINVIIGVGQFFTVLFCLVGWGWSIWWGVIMVKIAKKHKKCKHLEAIEAAGSMPSINSNNREISQQKRT